MKRPTKKELTDLLNAPRSYSRDKKIKEYQNYFILKSNISRRLFDSLFQRCTKRKPSSERRIELMDKKSEK